MVQQLPLHARVSISLVSVGLTMIASCSDMWWWIIYTKNTAEEVAITGLLVALTGAIPAGIHLLIVSLYDIAKEIMLYWRENGPMLVSVI